MKALPYLNLVTLTRSWAWVILEGDTGVNYLHGLYLRHQLTLHDLRTNGSLRDILSCASDVVPYCRTLAHVMESNESSSDSTPSDSGSHILGTLDNGQMGFFIAQIVGWETPDPIYKAEIVDVLVAVGGINLHV
jgi:hypothetical protein